MATVRIPDDLWARIQERAATQRRSATAELAALVEWALSPELAALVEWALKELKIPQKEEDTQ